MTATKPPAQPIELDPQDPLPESNWGYRRAFCFGGGVLLIGLKTYETYLDRQDWFTSFLILVLIVGYIISPSAEQAYKMFQLASLFKGGVSFKRDQRIEASSDKTTATQTMEVKPQETTNADDGGTGNDQVPNTGLAPPSADAPFFSGGGSGDGASPSDSAGPQR